MNISTLLCRHPLIKKWLCFLCLACLSACGEMGRPSGYIIGIDPSWYPLELLGKEKNVLAFSTELLQEISRLKKISLSTIEKNADNLFPGLEKEQYQGILSSVPPYLFYEKTYDFSDVYLATGPVLVVAADSSSNGLDKMSGREVAVIAGSIDNISIVEKYPEVLLRIYDSIPKALNDVATHTIDGMVLSVFLAKSYCQDLYKGQLKIATPPLNKEGLRLITLHGQSPHLISIFNQGLQELKASGKYAEIAEKWGFAFPD